MSEAGLEQKYVKEAFDTNWVVPLGPNVNGFEADLEEFVNSRDCHLDQTQCVERSRHSALTRQRFLRALHLVEMTNGYLKHHHTGIKKVRFFDKIENIALQA